VSEIAPARVAPGVARAPVLRFVALALALGAAGFAIEQRMRSELRGQAVGQLAAAADLKTGQIASWRAERLADAAAIAAPPVGPEALARFAAGQPPPPVVEYLRAIQARHRYLDILVVDARGEPVFTTGPAPARLGKVTAETAARAISEGRATLSDLHRGEDGRVHVDAAAPIPSPRGPAAALVLRSDAETFLFPLLQAWPASSPSTIETLLVRRDGEDVLVLNELRHARGTALVRRTPVSHTGDVAAAAAAGVTGTRDGVDGRGVPVLAEIRAVPDSPWRLVAKVDHGEIFATEHHLAWAAWAAMGAFLALGGLLARTWWRAEEQARAAAERASLDEAMRHRAEVLANVYDGVISTDAEARVTSWNRSAERMYGWTEAEALGRFTPELLQTEHEPGRSTQWMFDELARHGRAEFSARHRTKSGAIVEVEARVIALRAADGTLLGYIGANRDVTERRRTEAELRRAGERLALAGRMASVGTLAAGVAHEVNNPLAYVIANLASANEAAEACAAACPDLRQSLREARDGAERVRQIVAELRTFSRPDQSARGPVDVRRVLDAAVNLARHEIRHRARVVKEYADVPCVVANEGRLAQAFLNLVVNAAQSIPEGQVDANAIRVVARPVDGRVAVEVSDTGVGIPAEHLDRIFDPFFTTKPVGVGTGLGLSICHGIVASLAGEIRVQSTPGRGSTFTVLLPAGAAPPPASERPPGAPAPPGRRGSVLVVDDEPALASSLRRLLARDHDVVTAGSAQAALDLVAGGARFDVILCDLMMPEITGMDLHERLSHLAPHAAAVMVFMTGGAFTDRARAFLDDPARRRVEKPFEPDAVRALVRELVGA
jgi:PAS domain S-box-containing protein